MGWKRERKKVSGRVQKERKKRSLSSLSILSLSLFSLSPPPPRGGNQKKKKQLNSPVSPLLAISMLIGSSSGSTVIEFGMLTIFS